MIDNKYSCEGRNLFVNRTKIFNYCTNPDKKFRVYVFALNREKLFNHINYKKIIILLAAVLILLLADRLILTSRGIKIKLEPEVLKASTSSELEINVYKSNMLDFKVPFTVSEVRFTVEEGGNLIEIVNESSGGVAKIKSKGIEGEAIVGIYSLRSGLQVSRVLIKVMPRDLAYTGFGTSFLL